MANPPAPGELRPFSLVLRACLKSLPRSSADYSIRLPTFNSPAEPEPPVPEAPDLSSEAAGEVYAAQDGVATKNTRETIFWGPSCPNEERNYSNDAHIINELYDADYAELLFQLYTGAHKSAVSVLLLPAIDSSCNALKADLYAYFDGGTLPTAIACAKALVFYRRHSPHLKPYMSDAKIYYYEYLCGLFRDFLEEAGHCVRTPRSSE